MKPKPTGKSKCFILNLDALKFRLSEAVATGSSKYDEIFIQQRYGLLDILEVVPSLRLTAAFIVQKC